MENTEQTDQTPGTNPEAGKPEAQPGQELLDEVTELADKFASVVKAAWNSEQRKQIETDVKTGLASMATSLEDGFKQVAASPEAKDLQSKAAEVGEKVSGTKFVADLADTLKTGLRALGDQLDKLSQELQEKNKTPSAGSETGAGAQEDPGEESKDIPISKV